MTITQRGAFTQRKLSRVLEMANLAPAGAVSRGLALAEKHIQQGADAARARGNTQLADAIEATIVTNAAQRNAVLVPTQIPAYNANAPLDADQLDHFISSKRAAECRSRGSESGAEVWELLDTDEEKDVYDRRLAEYSQLVDRLKAEIAAGNYD